MPALIVYAFVLGLVAAVNPCGFPLLPAYLALFTQGGERIGFAARTARGLACGALVTLGFVVVFALAGALVHAGVGLVAGLPWVMIGLGLAFAALGVRALAGRSVGMRMPALPFARGRGALAMLGFGAAYGTASLSCALPLFLAAVAGSLTRSGPLATLAVVLAYALGMGVFVLAASVVAVHAGAPVLRRLRRWGRAIPRIGGAVLALAGAYLVYYWVLDLVAPGASTAVTAAVRAVQEAVSGAISGAPWAVAAVALALAAGAFAAVAWVRSRAVPADRGEGSPRVGR